MIETLILGAIAVIASFFTGYFIGESHTNSVHIKYFGWEISAFPSCTNNDYLVDFKKGKKRFSVIFDPTKDRVDWIIKDVIDE